MMRAKIKFNAEFVGVMKMTTKIHLLLLVNVKDLLDLSTLSA